MVKENKGNGDFTRIQDPRIVVFDSGFHTVGFTPAFAALFKQPYRSYEFLKSRDLDFYAPDLEELGELDKFKQAAESDGSFIIDAYQTVIDEIRKPFVDRICVCSFKRMIYTMHLDALEFWRGDSAQMAEMVKYCEDLQEELFLDRMKTRNLEAQHSAIQENIDHVVLPLLYLLQDSGLDSRQASIVNSLISNLSRESAKAVDLNDRELELTARERQIYSLVYQGKSTAEIASILVISPRTVEFHRNNINRKKNLKQTSKGL